MALERLGSYINLVSGPFHPFGGAVDIVVVQQQDGTFKSSPWYVRFGKFQGVLKSKEKIVNISVNGKDAGFHMYLDHKGEAFFLHDADIDAEEGSSGVDFAMSPVSSGDEREDKMEKSEESQLHKGQNVNMPGSEISHVEIEEKLDKDENIVKKEDMEGTETIQLNEGKIVKRTGSRRVTMFQFLFRRSSKDKIGAGVERVNSLERAEIAADLLDMKWSTNLSRRDRKGFDSNSGDLRGQDENSEVVEVQLTEDGNTGLDLHESTPAVSEEVNVRVVESDSGNLRGEDENLAEIGETVNVRVVEVVVEAQSTGAGNADLDLDLHGSPLAESEKVDLRVVESDSGNLRGEDENLAKNGEPANVTVVEEVVEVQSTEAISAASDLHQSAVAENDEVIVRVVDSDSRNLRGQDENLAKIGETVNVRVVELVVETQPTEEAGNADLDLHGSSLAETEKVGLRVVESDSGNFRGQDENLAKNGEPENIRVVEEVVEVQSTEDGNTGLDLHESTPAVSEEEVIVRAVESDSGNLRGEDENLAKIGEPANVTVVEDVVEVQSTEASSAALDLHGSPLAESEKADLRVVESDSGNLRGEDENLAKNGEPANVRVVEEVVEAQPTEAGNADLDLHGSPLAESEKVGLRVVESDSGNLRGEDENLAKKGELSNVTVVEEVVEVQSTEASSAASDLHQSAVAENQEVNLRALEKSNLCNLGIQDEKLVKAAEEVELLSTAAGNVGLDLHEGPPTVSGETDASLSVRMDSMYVREVDANSSNLRGIDQNLVETLLRETVNGDSLELEKQELYDNSTGLLEPNPTTISIETSSDTTTIDKQFQVQKLEITDFPVKSTNLELSSRIAAFDKNGDKINQYLLNNSNGLEDGKSSYGVTFSENSEEMQFDFSDGERETEAENKIETKNNAATIPSNEIEEEADAIIDSESLRSETSPISIPCSTSDTTRNESMARSLPNIKFDKIELIERLSCSLETSEAIKGKDSLSSVLKGDHQSSSDLSQIKSDSGTVDDATLPEMGHEKLATISPLVELSLCKHMLSEGMGEEAARQAFDSQKITLEKFRELGPPNLIKNDKLIVRIGSRYFPYETAAPVVLGMASFGEPGKELLNLKSMIRVDRVEPSKSLVRAGGSWKWPFGFKRSKTISTISVAKEGLDSNLEEREGVNGKSGRKKVRSLVPTTEELASLHLKEGRNVVTFTFSTAMLGNQQVDARIFLWKWNTRIVISDVDGTITRSDVLGQFMPLVGVDWSQMGVAHLFSAIKDNGYQLLFLSARAISQAHLTRQFLFNLKQDGKALPDGPVVISPDGLFPSLYREVIRRAPHEFKISCLEAIKALFPADSDPFYAGFGNRDTDEISYLKVGVPMGKIFIINPKGEVAVHRRVDTKSYSSLHALVNGMFPPYSSREQEGFNDVNFWRLPLPEINF